MTDRKISIGRAHTVLTFGEGKNIHAVFSSIIARISKSPLSERITFTGPVHFEDSTARHIREMIFPILDRVCQELGISTGHFIISAVNLGAASAQDLGVQITGFSADVPVFIAMLSVILGLPVPQDLVATGHLASPDGHIAMVRSIPAKLKAAVMERTIRTFLYPAWTTDHSLETLTPREAQSIQEAILEIQNHLTLVPVRDIGDVIRSVFSEEDRVASGLRLGYFDRDLSSLDDDHSFNRIVRILTENDELRFWNGLERFFLAGQLVPAKRLLAERFKFQIREKRYPSGLGSRLRDLLGSLPPAVRRFKGIQNLVAMRAYLDLSRFSQPTDEDDVKNLFDALFGKGKGTPRLTDKKTAGADVSSLPGDPTLDAILSEISVENLSQKIGLPIDAARGVYRMDKITVESHEEFNDAVTAFYLHLLRHYQILPILSDCDAVAGDAYPLLERGFTRQGGSTAAYVEGRDGTNGGMRFVFDTMTEQFKREEQAKHISRIFHDALDPLDWNGKVDLIRLLLSRLAPHLPEDLKRKPPEQLARHYEAIVRAYVSSMDTFKSLLKTL